MTPRRRPPHRRHVAPVGGGDSASTGSRFRGRAGRRAPLDPWDDRTVPPTTRTRDALDWLGAHVVLLELVALAMFSSLAAISVLIWLHGAIAS